MNRRSRRRAWLAGVSLAIALLVELTALLGGCDDPQAILNEPATHPDCGAPVAALGARQLQRAYGVPAILAAGIDGAGTTIAVILPYANPWVAHDLDVYSSRYGLPPARLKIVRYDRAPAAVAHGDPGHWAHEGTGDVEMMHALAPGATLVYVEVPASDPLMMFDQALAWTVARIRPDVISYSAGSPEFTGLLKARSGLEAAARAGITVVAGTGDTGGTQPDPADPAARTLMRAYVALWPASDPLVTAVGGTRLYLNAAGVRVRPDTAFSDVGGTFAGGAGWSAFFPRPAWQDAARRIAGDHRAIADVSMDASNCSPGVIYQQALAPAGWGTTRGTSMSTALFAGIVADAAQAAGHRLGPLGPALYSLHGSADGLLDVTQGNDSIPGLPGWSTGPGYDLPTGIGTVAAAFPFVTALARGAS